MAVVSLKIGERFYKFSCPDGQENHMRHLAEGLDVRANQLIKKVGYMQEGQLLAMLCLFLAEEKSKLEHNTNAVVIDETKKQLSEKINNLVAKINGLVADLNELTQEQKD